MEIQFPHASVLSKNFFWDVDIIYWDTQAREMCTDPGSLTTLWGVPYCGVRAVAVVRTYFVNGDSFSVSEVGD